MGKKKNKSVEDVYGRVDKRSAQSVIPFVEWYSNGIIRLDESRYCIVCTFSNAGYLSKTDSEKERKYKAYQAALASLPSFAHYEEIISNRPVDRQAYLNAVASVSAKEAKNDYERAFFDVQRKLVGEVDREISIKRYLLSVSIEVAENENPANKLLDIYSSLDTRYREMGSSLQLMTADEVFSELFYWYNPDGGTMPELPPDIYRRGLTIKDVLSSDGVRVAPEYIRLGDSYARIFSITSYGSEIVDNICYTILNNDLPVSISKHIEHVDKEDALKNVKKQLQELESRKQSRLSKNHREGTTYVPVDLERSIEGCNQLLDALAGNEEFLRQTVYVTVRAQTAELLDEYCNRVKSAALSAHCVLRSVRYFQLEGFKSALPLGKDFLTRHQFLLSSEAAIMTPFTYESYFKPNGFWYGRNEYSGEPIVYNRKLDKSANGFVFGVTGSGKGMWVKNEMTSILYQPFTRNDNVIVVDASGEFIPLCNAVHGKTIELMPASDTHLNPLYISSAQERLLGRQQARASKIDHLIALLSQIKSGDGLNAKEKSITDMIAGQLLTTRKPTLNTFYERLREEDTLEASEMCTWLQRYVEGSVTLFSGEETFPEESERMTVYSVRNLTGELRNAGMLAMLERIEARVMENHEAGRWTWIYIDEMHRYFDAERNPYAAARFARLYAEMRKYGAMLTGITQLPLPVVSSKDGSAMLSNSRFVVMAELDESNIDAVARLYSLNDDQRRTLASPSVGQYVVRMNNAPLSLRMLYPDKNMMYDLFNTAFGG